ncbi:hypothetical protein HN451_03655 [archaeon]|nr:hypothetical protein [archaeon]
MQRLKINAPIRSIQENLGFSWGFGKHMNFLSYFSFDTKIYFGQIQFLIFIISGYILLNNKNNKKFKQYFIYFILCIIIVLLIMGPNTYVSPYYLLYTFWPFINRVGYPDRLFPFLLLFSGLSSGILFKYINKNKNLKKHKHAILIIIILSIMISQILRSPWFRNHWIFFP